MGAARLSEPAVANAGAPLQRRARPGLAGRVRRQALETLLRAASLGLLLGLWVMVVLLPGLERVPGPLSVTRAALDLSPGPFLVEAGRSLFRVGAGFLLAAAVGIPLGLAIGLWPLVRALAFPPVEVLRPIPPIAWIPLSILFFVSAEAQIVFLTFYGALFPIVYNTIGGVGGIDRTLIRAARSLGASQWHVFRHIVWPGTMPHVFTGLSVAVGITWLMVIAAEMIATRGGLGYLTWEAYATFNYPMIFVGMAAIGVLGALSSALVRWVDRRIMPWRRRF